MPLSAAEPSAAVAPVWGHVRPKAALRLEVGARPVELPREARQVLLVPGQDAYLALSAALLAQLDDAGVETYLAHPDEAEVAFRLTLRDEAEFGAWAEEARPGKLRVIQRADGLEVQTSVGKLPGPDPHGPTLPSFAGRIDVAGLRRAFALLRTRFGKTPDACLVPSFATDLSAAARALSGFFEGRSHPFFPELCLVYPRP